MKPSGLVVCLSAVLWAALPPSRAGAALIIDNFETYQSASVFGAPLGFKSSFSSLSDGGVIGGERDIYVERTSANGGAVSAESLTDAPTFAAYASSVSTRGNALYTWDGTDGAAPIDFTGLGGLDLTEGGAANAFLGRSTSDHGTDIFFTVYTDALNFSRHTLAVPALGGAFTFVDFTLAFSGFTAVGGSGADFTNVGAITMFINGQTAALDVAVDFVTTGTTIPVPPSLVMGLACLALFALARRRLAFE